MSNKRNFNYIEGILRRWDTDGYKTIHEIEIAEMEHLQRKEKEGQDERYWKGSGSPPEEGGRITITGDQVGWIKPPSRD